MRQKSFFISKDVWWNKNCITYVKKKTFYVWDISSQNFRTIQSSHFFPNQRKLQFLIDIKAHFVDRIYFSQGTLLLVIWNTIFLLFFLLFLNLNDDWSFIFNIFQGYCSYEQFAKVDPIRQESLIYFIIGVPIIDLLQICPFFHSSDRSTNLFARIKVTTSLLARITALDAIDHFMCELWFSQW